MSRAGLRPVPVVAGVDVLLRHDREADAAVARLVSLLRADGRSRPWIEAAVIATHGVRSGPGPHVALSLGVSHTAVATRELPHVWDALWAAVDGLAAGRQASRAALVLGGRACGPPALQEGARAAVAEHATRSAGRAVHFRGADALAGDVTVEGLLAASAVERVVVLAAGDADPGAVLRTRGHVRPRWSDGVLVLHAQPAGGGVLVPFEVPFPTPCCADHA